MSNHTSEPTEEDTQRLRALTEAMLDAMPDKTLWHDVFQAAMWVVDSVEVNAERSGLFRHFMAATMRRMALQLTHKAMAQMEPEDKGPTATNVRITALTDRLFDCIEGQSASEAIAALLNGLDVVAGFCSANDRKTIAAKMRANADAIEGAEATPISDTPRPGFLN